MKKPAWFVARTYGWGWTPATREGWMVLGIYVLLVLLNFLRIDRASHSVSDTLIAFVPETILMTFVLVWICYTKGEKPRWRWGK